MNKNFIGAGSGDAKIPGGCSKIPNGDGISKDAIPDGDG